MAPSPKVPTEIVLDISDTEGEGKAAGSGPKPTPNQAPFDESLPNDQAKGEQDAKETGEKAQLTPAHPPLNEEKVTDTSTEEQGVGPTLPETPENLETLDSDPHQPPEEVEDDEAEEELLAVPPPEQPSANAIKCRMRRVFCARSDGTFLLPESVIQQYEDKDQRLKLQSQFQKVNYSVDRGC